MNRSSCASSDQEFRIQPEHQSYKRSVDLTIRMPFGLANAGSVYSRMLDVAMKEVERDFWTSYLDNILTFSTGLGIHFGHLSQVVLVHGAADIKIQPCKSKLFQSEVEYLGHKISKEGVKMIPEYVHKVTNWPVPTSGK